MLEKGKISPRQAMLLTIAFLLGSAILLIPSATTASARQDAWLSMILATLAGLVIIYVYTSLALRFPDLNFVQYSEKILGRFAGKLAGLIMIWFALHLGSLVTRNFGDFLNITVLQNTPLAVINSAILLLSAIVVKKGLEVIARVNELTLPFLIILIFVLTALSMPETDIRRLEPVLENGIKPVIAGALPAIGFPFAETVLFTMIIPYVNHPGRARRSMLTGALAGGFLLFLVILRTLTVLSPGATAKFWYPALESIRMIDLFNIIQRVEVVIIVGWIILGFMKITVCLYAFVLGLAQWLNLKDYRPLSLPAGVLMVSLSLFVYGNYTEEAAFAAKIWFPYAIPVTFILPLVMLTVAWIQGLGQRD